MDQKRLFLAIAISVAILLGFQLLIAPHLPHPPPPPPAQVANNANPTPSSSLTPAQGGAVAAATAAAPKNVPRVKIAAPRLSGSISLLGARLDDLVLTDYRETLAPNSPHVRLLEPLSDSEPYYVQYGWSAAPGEQVKLPGNDTVWATSADTLGAGHPVTLSWDNAAGLTFQIELSVDDNYMFTVRQSVKNATGTPVKLFPWSRVRRDYTPETSGYYILFEGLLGVVDNTLQEFTYANTKSETEKKKNPIAYDATATGGWAGFTDKYWLTALVPDQAAPVTVNFTHIAENGDHYQVDYLAQQPQTIEPNGDAMQVSHVFAGAKIVSLLQDYEFAPADPALRLCGGLGLLLVPDAADLPGDRLAEQRTGEFRPGHHGVHPRGKTAVLPAGELLVPVDEQDEAARPEDAGAAGAVQGRAAAHAARDDGDVPGREGEPGLRLSADGGADPGVLLALQGDLHHHRDAAGAVLWLDP